MTTDNVLSAQLLQTIKTGVTTCSNAGFAGRRPQPADRPGRLRQRGQRHPDLERHAGPLRHRYKVYSATTSGGPYTQTGANVTPRTTTQFSDSPGLGQKFYVVSAYYQN